ncbi:MAG: NTP transferase domain-containing protein [Proteobacteria bacterium]|nr:NTP transferase domain-containing protein [Pseudomonadota bacterium]
MTRDATWAVVPVKPLEAAKRRLAGALDPAARRGLSLAMLADVLDALAAAPGLDGIAVVSRDARVMEFTRRRGHRVIEETGADLNAAVAQAANVLSAEGFARLLVMPADLPLAGPEEIAQAKARLGAAKALMESLFGLAPGSPCIDAGTDVGQNYPAIDGDGISGDQYDIGPFEFAPDGGG